MRGLMEPEKGAGEVLSGYVKREKEEEMKGESYREKTSNMLEGETRTKSQPGGR